MTKIHGLPSPPNHCFGCGEKNLQGMHLKFSYDGAHRRILSKFRLSRRYSGPPGYCHGGIIATILDEVMAKLNRPRQVTAVTSRMSIAYLKPVPLQQPLRAEAWETRATGRRHFRSAEIRNEQGTVLARATGTFIAIDARKMFGRAV